MPPKRCFTRTYTTTDAVSEGMKQLLVNVRDFYEDSEKAKDMDRNFPSNVWNKREETN